MLKFPGGVITAARERADSLMVATAMAVVSFCSGFISYTHICALTLREGGSWKVAHLMPFCIDGQLVIGSAYFMYGETKWQKFWGLVLGVIPGIGESLVANWQSGIVHGYFAAGWATVPAQAFACSTILFERWLHRSRAARPAQQPALAALAIETIPQAPEPAAPVAQEAAPALVHVTARPAGEPWGLVSPAAAPAPPPAPVPVPVPQFAVPVLGPVMTLAARPKARPAAVDDARLPWPGDEAERARLVNSMTRNELWRTYQLSKHAADKAREQYLSEQEVA